MYLGINLINCVLNCAKIRSAASVLYCLTFLLFVCTPSAVKEKQRNVSGCVGRCWELFCGCCRDVHFTARSWENWVPLPAQRPASTHAKKDFTAWWAAPRTELWSTLPVWRIKVSELNKYCMWWYSCIRLSALNVFLSAALWPQVPGATLNKKCLTW